MNNQNLSNGKQIHLNQFEKALKSNDNSLSNFTLKVRFSMNGQNVEHMWMNQIVIENGRYFGVLNNEPEYKQAVKMGDSLEINKKDISDWMYLKGNKLYGGYTIKVLRNKMNDQEKKQFDAEQGLSFE